MDHQVTYQNRILARSEILAILFFCGRTEGLSRSQIEYIHYMLGVRLSNKIPGELSKYRKLQLFSMVDYEEELKRLILNDFLHVETKHNKFIYTITEQGKILMDNLKSEHSREVRKVLIDIFMNSIDETRLKMEVLPQVTI